jgi:hypothetical protein
MTEMDPGNRDWVTTREMYEKLDQAESKLYKKLDQAEEKLETKLDGAEAKIESNHGEVMRYITQSKVAFAVIGVLVASPKLGGPTAEQLITGALRFVGT